MNIYIYIYVYILAVIINIHNSSFYRDINLNLSPTQSGTRDVIYTLSIIRKRLRGWNFESGYS